MAPLSAPSSVGEALGSVTDSHPDMQPQLLAPNGGLNRHVTVYLNDGGVRVLSLPQTDHQQPAGREG